MSNVIQFCRYVNVTGWSLNKIRDYMKKHKWAGFVLHWDDERVVIERVAG